MTLPGFGEKILLAMAQKYLLIESRDPFDCADVPYFFKVAKDLAQKGEDVILYLVQNAVFCLRKGARPSAIFDWLGERSKSGVKILADDFSLRERAIRKEELVPDVQVSNVDAVVDFLVEEKRKAIWH